MCPSKDGTSLVASDAKPGLLIKVRPAGPRRGSVASSGPGASGERMVSGPLLLAALVDALAGIFLAYAAQRVLARGASLSDAARRANLLFGVWWICLAVGVGLNALWEAAGASGTTRAAWLTATDYVYVLSIVGAAWAILYYVLYVFTGRRGIFWPLTVFYAAYAALGLWTIWRIQPTGLNVSTWFVGWDYARIDAVGPLLGILVILLILPNLIAIGAYATLGRKLVEPQARRRVMLVTVGVLVWLLTPVLGDATGLSRVELWQAGSRFLMLAAAIAILVAFGPKLRVPTPRASRDDALAQRILELV